MGLRIERPAFVFTAGGTMARSVVLNGSPRCEGCQLPPRWCICQGARKVECALQVDVLMHHRERSRPSSTGQLIKRVIPESGLHFYRGERPLECAAVAQEAKTLWILHPQGEPLPADVAPASLQVLLLDGSWQQASRMMRAVKLWGRSISLPVAGANRYWLRTEAGAGNYCTVEALIFLLAALGLEQAQVQLRLQFELHVYAGLCSRGAKTRAAQYLATSAVREALSEVIESCLHQRAPGAAARRSMV